MRRREFITALGSAVAWPLAARAQQPAMPVVGFLNGVSPEGYARYITAFRQGFAETGFIAGRNVTFEQLWATARPAAPTTTCRSTASAPSSPTSPP
jgi:putative tryptophan/tyrosine transport system substrate-binding protein